MTTRHAITCHQEYDNLLFLTSSLPDAPVGGIVWSTALLAEAEELSHDAIGESVVWFDGKLGVLDSGPDDGLEAKSRVVDALQQTNANVGSKDVGGHGVMFGRNKKSNLVGQS
ncbi:hypothetical protein FSHL1_012425 [Fusarium sambucinum]